MSRVQILIAKNVIDNPVYNFLKSNLLPFPAVGTEAGSIDLPDYVSGRFFIIKLLSYIMLSLLLILHHTVAESNHYKTMIYYQSSAWSDGLCSHVQM